MRPLDGAPASDPPLTQTDLLVLTVGVKQMPVVQRLLSRFNASAFQLMLFHYDGAVDAWGELAWGGQVVSVAARKQTKWWFAKVRYLSIAHTYVRTYTHNVLRVASARAGRPADKMKCSLGGPKFKDKIIDP